MNAGATFEETAIASLVFFAVRVREDRDLVSRLTRGEESWAREGNFRKFSGSLGGGAQRETWA